MEVKRLTIKNLVKRLNSESDAVRTQSLAELRLMSKHDPDSRPLIAAADGAITTLVHLLTSPESTTTTIEMAVATLLNLSISSPHPLMSSPKTVDSLSSLLLPHSSPTASSTAAATLFSLLTVEAYRPIIGSKTRLLSSLISLLTPNSRSKDYLKALFAVALYPLNRPSLVSLGAVPALLSLILSDGRTGIVEDSTAVLSQIAGCDDSLAAFRNASALPVLFDLVDPSTGPSVRTRENAVAALLNFVLCGGQRAVDELKYFLPELETVKDFALSGSDRGKAKASALLRALGSHGLTV